MLYNYVLGAAWIFASTMAATLTVQVGPGGQKIFEPNNIKARVGDIFNFEIVGGNHTVTQSTFASPCTRSGFTSGFRPPGTDTTFAIMVNTTEPMWFYCSQANHCQAGMVMAINAADTGDKTFDAFKALAMGTSPGGSSPNSTTDSTPSGGGGQAGTPVSGGTPSGGSPSGVAASSGSATASSGSIPGSTSASGNAPSASASGGAGFTLASPALGMLSVLLLQLGLL